jgi:uncharacterized protein (TIGR00288 family)
MAMVNDSNGSLVAVLIDYENVVIEFGKKIRPPEQINWEKLLEATKSYGGPLICKAYADWSGNRAMQDRFSKLGVQPITVPSKRWGKNGVDVRMAVDAIDMLVIKNTNIGTLVLVSGDGDFTSLVNYLKDYGKYVVGIGVERATAEYLLSACHEYKYLMRSSELVDANKKPVGDLKEPPPAAAEANREPGQPKDPSHEVQDVGNGTEPLEKEYLGILHKHRILIEPTEDRQDIIKRCFHILKINGGSRLADIKDKIISDFEINHSGIAAGYINESIQQIVKADCLNFDNPSGECAQSSPPWERKAYLKSWIDTPVALVRTVDRFLIEIIRRDTAPKEIDCAALSTVLYGTSKKPQLVKCVRYMVDGLGFRTPN